MKRTPLRRKTSLAPRRRIPPTGATSRPVLPTPPLVDTGPRRVAGITRPAKPRAPAPKRAVVVSGALRRSACGETCTVESPVCTHDPATVVLAHLPSDIGGAKASDLSSCYACAACHDAIDRRRIVPAFEGARDWYLRRAMVRTWTRWVETGRVTINAGNSSAVRAARAEREASR